MLGELRPSLSFISLFVQQIDLKVSEAIRLIVLHHLQPPSRPPTSVKPGVSPEIGVRRGQLRPSRRQAQPGTGKSHGHMSPHMLHTEPCTRAELQGVVHVMIGRIWLKTRRNFQRGVTW